MIVTVDFVQVAKLIFIREGPHKESTWGGMNLSTSPSGEKGPNFSNHQFAPSLMVIWVLLVELVNEGSATDRSEIATPS